MTRFRVGDRVMVPVDEPQHRGSQVYLGRSGTVTSGTVTNSTQPQYDPRLGQLIGVHYDAYKGYAPHDTWTWEACLVHIQSDLDKDLLCAIAPLFMRENT